VVSLWCDTLFVIHDRSAATLTAMDGGNAENAGAFFGPGGRRSHQSDITTQPTALCQFQDKNHRYGMEHRIKPMIRRYGKELWQVPV